MPSPPTLPKLKGETWEGELLTRGDEAATHSGPPSLDSGLIPVAASPEHSVF